MKDIEKHVGVYIRELNYDGPAPSYSHRTLRWLYDAYGISAVDAELNKAFRKEQFGEKS